MHPQLSITSSSLPRSRAPPPLAKYWEEPALNASGQAVELGGGLVGVAVDELSFPCEAHSANAGLNLVSLGFSAFHVDDSAVDLDVATEELQALGLLAHFSVRLSQGTVVVTEADIGQALFTLPEQAVAFDVAERERQT